MTPAAKITERRRGPARLWRLSSVFAFLLVSFGCVPRQHLALKTATEEHLCPIEKQDHQHLTAWLRENRPPHGFLESATLHLEDILPGRLSLNATGWPAELINNSRAPSCRLRFALAADSFSPSMSKDPVTKCLNDKIDPTGDMRVFHAVLGENVSRLFGFELKEKPGEAPRITTPNLSEAAAAIELLNSFLPEEDRIVIQFYDAQILSAASEGFFLDQLVRSDSDRVYFPLSLSGSIMHHDLAFHLPSLAVPPEVFRFLQRAVSLVLEFLAAEKESLGLTDRHIQTYRNGMAKDFDAKTGNAAHNLFLLIKNQYRKTRETGLLMKALREEVHRNTFMTSLKNVFYRPTSGWDLVDFAKEALSLHVYPEARTGDYLRPDPNTVKRRFEEYAATRPDLQRPPGAGDDRPETMKNENLVARLTQWHTALDSAAEQALASLETQTSEGQIFTTECTEFYGRLKEETVLAPGLAPTH